MHTVKERRANTLSRTANRPSMPKFHPSIVGWKSPVKPAPGEKRKHFSGSKQRNTNGIRYLSAKFGAKDRDLPQDDSVLTIPTDSSSDVSHTAGILGVSSNASTLPASNEIHHVHEAQTSEMVARPPTTIRNQLWFKADMQLARQKIEQMGLSDDLVRSTSMPLEHPSRADAPKPLPYQSRNNEHTAISPRYGKCVSRMLQSEAQTAAEDIVQATVAVFSCGMVSDYRPITGSLEDDWDDNYSETAAWSVSTVAEDSHVGFADLRSFDSVDFSKTNDDTKPTDNNDIENLVPTSFKGKYGYYALI